MSRRILFLMLLPVMAGCGVERRSQTDGARGEGESQMYEGEGEGEGSACTCTDNVECTEDTCVGDTCVNTPVHAYCGAGKICNPDAGGCSDATVCRDDAECVSDDPCTIGVCESATRACAFLPLDGDADQHQPRVCGGDDCDDGNPTTYPNAEELCNDADDNCDGQTDEGINLAEDHENCGACGNACEDGFVCIRGDCGCPSDFGICMDGDGNEACFDLRTNQNCGECDNECVGEEDCVDGACVITCEPNERICATDDPDSPQSCVDMMFDGQHCGGCGRECRGIEECHQGVCICGWPMSLCDGFCTNTSFDPENCGSCGHACAENEACIGNGCFACQEGVGGAVECDGRCTITRFDWFNCGACGNRCPPNRACNEGHCAN